MKIRKGPKDPESIAAQEIVFMERRQEELAELQLKKREIAAASLFEEIGKIKAMNFNRSQAEFMTLIFLKRLKESKGYKEDLGMTWQQVCDMVGISRAGVDNKLADMKPFKDEFLLFSSNFLGFDYNKIKYLAESERSGIAKIEQKSLVYNGHKIPLTEDHIEDIQNILDQIQMDLQKRAEEAEEEIRKTKRKLRDSDSEVSKLQKENDAFKGKARSKDLSPEEDGFLTQMEQLRIQFDGYMLRADPQRMEELLAANAAKEGDPSTVTPRMRASYLEVVGYMRRQIIAAHDTAVEMYGADLEEGKGWGK